MTQDKVKLQIVKRGDKILLRHGFVPFGTKPCADRPAVGKGSR